MSGTLFTRTLGFMAGAVAAVVLHSTPVVAAQMELGAVQGTIKDEAGQPIAGATIRLTDSERGRSVEVKSDSKGNFYRRGLQAVDYEFVVEKPGYNSIKDHLKVSAGLEKRFDFKLVKGAPLGAEEFAKGVAAFNSGDNAAAAAAFEESLKKAPDLPEVHVNLALAYLRLTRTADAVAQLEKARSLAPDKPTILFQLGEAYVEVKDYDKSIASIEQGLAKVGSPTEPMALDGMLTLGAVYFAKGDNDKAIAQFEKVAAARPGAAPPMLGLAKAYSSKGDTAKALETFRQVVARSPGTPEAAEAAAFITALDKK